MRRVFLLSPANLSGRRAKHLLKPEPKFALAQDLRSSGAPLGDVFSFISGLYFAGSLRMLPHFGTRRGIGFRHHGVGWAISSERTH